MLMLCSYIRACVWGEYGSWSPCSKSCGGGTKARKMHQYQKYSFILGDPEVTANICCKSRNLPNTDMQNYSTDLR